MKIVVLSNSRDVVSGNAAPQIVLGADSALLRAGEPVFLADTHSNWTSQIAPAVRIGRLGTHIPEAVALSYVDGHTLFHLLVDNNATARYNSLWGMTDRTFSPGQWLPGAFERPLPVQASLSQLRGEAKEITAEGETPDSRTVAAAISALSKWCTFKTGDVIIFADNPIALPASPDSRIEAAIGNEQVLNLKIK